MCGIAGFISPRNRFKVEHLYTMTNRLAHRGPDMEGCFSEQGVGLGHRRLSILDLSEEAQQPMFSHDERYVLVYNGEVYNYREIAEKLKISSRTTSDSEIILEAFIKEGPKFVHQLNGMFALAILDKQTRNIFLFRDRLGVKPLFYMQNESGDFLFASELKALTAVSGPLTLNKDAVHYFLHLGYIPAPHTIYREAFKFPQGSYAIVNAEGQVTFHCYWEPETLIDPVTITDETAAKNQLREHIESSVRYRLISDVPVGIFLSGGIDSSTVAAFASKVSDTSVKTFSIGFTEKAFDESPFAAQVARHLKTEHYEYILTEEDALDRVDALSEIYDEPYADSSAIPTLLVSEFARKHVKVALSGDGGDELFMGYGMYRWARRLNKPLTATVGKLLSGVFQRYGSDRLQRGFKVFDTPSREMLRSHIFSQEQYLFSHKETQALTRLSTAFIPLREKFDPASRALCAEEEQALFDMHYYLPDDLLVKTDRAGMYHSLEIREPLLDFRIVQFALNLDMSLKYRSGITKYLLKQVLYELVPASLFERPKKGFAVPMAKWLQKELRSRTATYLSKDLTEDLGLLNPSYVQNLLSDFYHGKKHLYNRVWTTMVLQEWLVKNKNTLKE